LPWQDMRQGAEGNTELVHGLGGEKGKAKRIHKNGGGVVRGKSNAPVKPLKKCPSTLSNICQNIRDVKDTVSGAAGKKKNKRTHIRAQRGGESRPRKKK